MDWRRPIEQQKPVASPAAERDAEQNANFIDSDEYRRADHDPALIHLAFQANAYRESLRREARKL